jgi:putative inorganic carbon (HCO3(-)) transporter
MIARKILRQRASWGLFALFAIGFGWLMANQMIMGFSILGAVIATFFAFLCFVNVQWAVCFLTAYAFYNSDLATLLIGEQFQAGIPMDAMLVITLFGLLVNRMQVREAGQKFFRQPIVIWWLVIFGYFALLGANPLARSPVGWLQVCRKEAEQTMLMFICYCAFDSPGRIKNFIKALFVMSVLAGLYGCIQQWHGLFPFEMAWVMADSNRFGLLFVMGEFRKWSTMADPTTFGIIMAAMTAMYIIIALYLRDTWRRLVLGAGCLFMVLGMVYSGTRTANVVLLAGFFMFLLLQANKRSTWVFGLGMLAVLIVVLNLPIYSSSALNRFRTSFQGSKDASFNVRELSRHFIQPYIYQHPFGGGHGTTNDLGRKNNPGHYLAGFQTDDGYLRIALETGWIGLLMVCGWNFVVLRTGIRAYFRARSLEGRYLNIAVMAGLVPFMVASIAQDVYGQMSNDAVIFPLVAMLMRLDVFEEPRRS